jgi:hypothetical protein
LQSGAAAAADVDGVGRQLRQELVALGAPHHLNPRGRVHIHSQLDPTSPDSALLGVPCCHSKHHRGIDPGTQAARSRIPRKLAAPLSRLQSPEDPTNETSVGKASGCEPHEAAAAVERKGRKSAERAGRGEKAQREGEEGQVGANLIWFVTHRETIPLPCCPSLARGS